MKGFALIHSLKLGREKKEEYQTSPHSNSTKFDLKPHNIRGKIVLSSSYLKKKNTVVKFVYNINFLSCAIQGILFDRFLYFLYRKNKFFKNHYVLFLINNLVCLVLNQSISGLY